MQIRAEALKQKILLQNKTFADGSGTNANHFEIYRNDPIRFGTEILGEKYTDPIKHVMESVRDNPVTIAVSANATGKSHAAARIAVWFYTVYPESQVYTTAAPPERNLRKILWGEIGRIVRNHPNLFEGGTVSTGMNIQRNSQSFITGVSIPFTGTPEQREAKFSGKHAPFLLFIVDEADAVPPEVFKGIESCLSGGMGRLLIMFNPRHDSGMVARMVKYKEGNVLHLSAFDHPNVITGEDQIPGAVTQEKTIRRINEWSRPLASDESPDVECYEVPKFLVGKIAKDKANIPYPPLPAGKRKVTNPSFFYMVLGIYPPQSETQLISRAWIDTAVSRYQSYVALYGEAPPKAVTPIIGVDVADMGKDNNALTQRWGGWVAPLRVWNGIDTEKTAVKIVEIIKYLDVPLHKVKVRVDGTGVGAGVAPRIATLGVHDAKGIMVASSPTFEPKDDSGNVMGVFFQMRDQLWWSVMLWLKNDIGAMIPPDEELIEELVTPSYGVYNGRVRISDKNTMKETLGRSPDKAESLMMTFAPDEPTAGAW